MRKTVKKFVTLVLVMMMVGLTFACGKEEVPSDVRVGSLKGPTSIGLVELMERADRWTTPILILFFVISGAELDLTVFTDEISITRMLVQS